MYLTEIEKHMEYLFSIALKKCRSLEDAEDLTQEVLLVALRYDKAVDNTKAWLSSVLNHKYYDMLRKKYKLPTVSIDFIPEEAEPIDDAEEDSKPNAETVRREVAYLAEKYREVIVRHYLYGEKVQDIADKSGLPKGTVLSRLAYGREQMRKGFDEMESYEKQSYQPEKLDVSCNGRMGLNGEPWSLVTDDMMKQNILIAAYEKPLTPVEIARALGIPTAYIEKAVDDLVVGQLMTRAGNKVFTDFMITTPEEILGVLDYQIDFSAKHYNEIWKCIKEAVKSLEKFQWYQEMPTVWQGKCAYYYILHIFSTGIFTAERQFAPAEEEFPLRPDGGKWIAMGSRYPLNFVFENYKFRYYTYGGERRSEYENFLSEKSVCLHVYDTQPDLNRYERGPVEIHDDKLCALVYLIYKGIPIDAVTFDPLYLQAIPHLAECGIFKYVNDKPSVNIPVIQKSEYLEMDQLRIEYMYKLTEVLTEPLRSELSKIKLPIPSHLENRITEFRKYACYAIPMATIKQAIEKGDFIDNSNKTPPMVLVIDS
ncbi:MAG: hypothetical protein A2Y17_12945 [Clostridiales bacterium GWF2_38_85]|nr:MAG: hypothetical protein A2Y17_12945 [Clostridiales bacterium GWF2_38_85]HBL84166.1 hypothetical protein [Clostridiales bacterium]